MTDDSTPFDPIRPDGPGFGSFSDADVFYLTHEKRIEEWHALREGAANSCHTWMRDTVHPMVSELAGEIGADPIYVRANQSRESLLVVPGTPLTRDRPAIAVGLGWNHTKVGRSTAGDDGRIYIGVVVDLETAQGKVARQAFLASGGRALREIPGMKSHKECPVYRYIELEPHWWGQLGETSDQALADLRDFWSTCIEPMSAAVESTRSA